MRATFMYEAGDVRVEGVPDPRLVEPTDAILRVTRVCICGSDLWAGPGQQRATSSSTRTRGSSTPTGAAQPATSPPSFATPPAATTIATCQTSSASSPPRAKEFRTHWAVHNVRLHDSGVKHYHHPVVGDMTLTYNRLDLSAGEGLRSTVWTAEPGCKSAEALNLLGSWAATLDPASLTHTSSRA